MVFYSQVLGLGDGDCQDLVKTAIVSICDVIRGMSME